MDADQLWSQALSDIELCMTHATFETHVQGTTAVDLTDDVLTVRVPNKFSREWLDARLRPTIEERVQHHAGRAIKLDFIIEVQSDSSLGMDFSSEMGSEEGVTIRLRHVDPRDWKPEIVSRYAIMFWQPLLGPKSFCVWLTLKMFADAPEPPSLTTITIMTTNSTDTRRLLGRENSNGALDPLVEHKIIAYHQQPSGKYVFDVLARLPLLTPSQVAQLHVRRQRSHERILDKFGVDVSEWRRIQVETLANVT